jgi:hypothetical protein
MDTIIINETEYIKADELFDKAPLYCRGLRTTRDIKGAFETQSNRETKSGIFN